MNLIFDIETIRNVDVPYSGEEKEGAIVAAPHHKIVVFGMLTLSGASRHYAPHGLYVGDSEPNAIYRFSEMLGTCRLVSFAGRTFDLPVIQARAFALGIPLTGLYVGRECTNYGDYRNRYDAAHVDLMDELSERGSGTRARLDAYARLIGFPGKVDGDGGKVAALMGSGDIEAVRTYCAEDLLTTAAIFIRWQRLRGNLSLGDYALAVQELHAFACAEPRLAAIEALVDWERFGSVLG